MNCFLFIVAFQVLSSAYVESGDKRVTRIINGELVFGRTTGYDAVRYYAAVGTQHGESTFDLKLFEVKLHFGALTCGGALITRGIVQTACHCLSYDEQPDIQGRFLPARVKHDWEYILRVYIGVNKQFDGKWSMANVAPIIAKKFMVHQLCAYLPRGTLELPTHDYGWIILDSNWDPNVKYAGRVNFAPLYTEDELLSTWDYLDARQAVCLLLGFGSNVDGVSPGNKRLRHGWLSLLSRWKCVLKSTFGLDHQSLHLMTWVCFVPFSKHYQSPAPGDSGSPVSCNNQYFAVLSGRATVKETYEDEEIKKFVGFSDPIYFAKYENAKEFRKDFIRFMEAYAGQIAEGINTSSTRTMKLHLAGFSTASQTSFYSSFAAFTTAVIRSLVKQIAL